jgi:hydrogenase expression/formation protein HypC
MCLAMPGKVIGIYSENDLLMGQIDFSGAVSKACLAYVPEVVPGQYVIVHAGFAIQILNEREAAEVFSAWDEVADAVEREGGTVTGRVKR